MTERRLATLFSTIPRVKNRPTYRPMKAARGAEKIVKSPPTVNPTSPRATISDTRSRRATTAVDLSLGRDCIRAQYTGKLDEETT
jgi:hypothetical protein